MGVAVVDKLGAVPIPEKREYHRSSKGPHAASDAETNVAMDGLPNRGSQGKYLNRGCGAFINNSSTDLPPISINEADEGHTSVPSYSSSKASDCNGGDSTATGDGEYGARPQDNFNAAAMHIFSTEDIGGIRYSEWHPNTTKVFISSVFKERLRRFLPNTIKENC